VPTPHPRIAVVRDSELDAALPANETTSAARHLRALALRGAALVVPGDDVAERLAPLHDGSRVTFFDMPRIDVSSSDIRRRVAGGRSVRHLVPDAVAQAIAEGDLYRTTVGRPAA